MFVSKYITLGFISVIVWFIVGCAGGGASLGSDRALTASQLKAKLVNGELYRDTESFYLLENNILMYEDKETRERTYGAWYIKKVYNPTKKHYVDSVCLVRGKTKKYIGFWTKATCIRLYPENDKHDNLYLGVYVPCHNINGNASNTVATEKPICQENDKRFGYYRIKKSKREE